MNNKSINPHNVTQLIKGSEIAQHIIAGIASEISQKHISPHLVIFLVGDNPASVQYVSMKEKRAKEAGIKCTILQFATDIPEDSLIELIAEMNENSAVSGIMIQLPLPEEISAKKVLDFVAPEKDVDGLSSLSLGKIIFGTSTFVPAVCKGIMTMISKERISLVGKDVTVIGNSASFGMPLSILLSQKGATVTICHDKTKNLDEHVLYADIIITAAGVPDLITGKMIKKGAIIIDGGTALNKKTGRIVGDVAFDSVQGIAAKVSPVPGGVGPMTIASLLEQTLLAYKNQHKN